MLILRGGGDTASQMYLILVDRRDAETNRVQLTPQVNLVELADVDVGRNAEALRTVVRF